MLLADKYMLVPGGVFALRQLVAAGQEVITYGYAVLRQHLTVTSGDSLIALASSGGDLTLPPRLPIAPVSAEDALQRLLRSARYPSEYPMLYTALAARRPIDNARSRSGRFFVGSCPDVASGLQLLASSVSYLFTQLPVVLVQYPGDPRAWSTGAAAVSGGALLGSYLAEIGPDTLRDPAERSASGAILETMRAFLRSRPDLEGSLGWTEFARHASREIEGRGPGGTQRHLALAQYLVRNGQGCRALWAQLRAAVGVHAPLRLKDLWNRHRRTRSDDWTPETATTTVATRRQALNRASEWIISGLADGRWVRPPVGLTPGEAGRALPVP